ncbi:hypothetical protein XI09_16860 [Bradyrhizobium sp. CCBAU 11386]|nr:hypothetical protein [Bradyrhizobium sp. CCBAU 11386]
MDWVLGIISVFCFAAGLTTLALALGVVALISNIGIIALRLRARGQGGFPDHGWVAPKLFTALMLVAAVWLFAAQAGYIG